MRKLIMAAALALAACTFPPPTVRVSGTGPVELPFRLAADGLVIVTGRVNGLQDVDFILDTGAPVTVLIDNDRTRALRLDTSGARRLGSDPASPTGVIRGGQSVEFGRVTLADLTAVLIPGASLPCPERMDAIAFGGVVGADLFRRFVVEIDWSARIVRLHEPESWSAPPGLAAVPLVFEDGHPYVQSTIQLADGRRIATRLHLDTGMNLALSLPTGDGAAFEAPAGGKARSTCYVSARAPATEGAAVTVELAGARIGEVVPLYTPRASASATRHGGAIGGGALRRQPLVIDYPRRRILVGVGAIL